MTIGRLVNAFFRWEFNSCEVLVKDGEVYPIDYANACPDVALTSLHYYFPWAMKALVKWCVFALVTGRRPRLDLETGRYFEMADQPGTSYAREAGRLPRAGRRVLRDRRATRTSARAASGTWTTSCWTGWPAPASTSCWSETVRSQYPAHEHDQFIAHLRGLLGLWVSDESARLRTA